MNNVPKQSEMPSESLIRIVASKITEACGIRFVKYPSEYKPFFISLNPMLPFVIAIEKTDWWIGLDWPESDVRFIHHKVETLKEYAEKDIPSAYMRISKQGHGWYFMPTHILMTQYQTVAPRHIPNLRSDLNRGQFLVYRASEPSIVFGFGNEYRHIKDAIFSTYKHYGYPITAESLNKLNKTGSKEMAVILNEVSVKRKIEPFDVLSVQTNRGMAQISPISQTSKGQLVFGFMEEHRKKKDKYANP